jgi:hypothetical protein
MHFDPSRFSSWQEAEHRATVAQRKLFAKLLSPEPNVPTREEVEEVRQLREAANAQMQCMLDEMRDVAASITGSVGH